MSVLTPADAGTGANEGEAGAGAYSGGAGAYAGDPTYNTFRKDQ